MQKQLVPIPFAGGLDTKTDPKQVAMGKLLQAQNVVFKQTGSLSRRWGYTAIPNGIQGYGSIHLGGGASMTTYNNQLIVSDGDGFYPYSPAQSELIPAQQFTACNQSNSWVYHDSTTQAGPDFGTTGTIDVYSWIQNVSGTFTVYYTIVDTATGTNIVPPTSLVAGVATKVIPFVSAGYVLVFYARSDTTTLGYAKISIASPTTAPPLTIVTPTLPTPINGSFDVVNDGNGKIRILVFTSNGNINLESFGSNFIPSAITVGTFTSVSPYCASITVDSVTGNLWLVWADNANTGFKGAIYNQSLVLQTAITDYTVSLNTVTQISVVAPGNGQGYIVIDVSGPQSHRIYMWQITGSSGISTGNIPFELGCGMASKAFVLTQPGTIGVAIAVNAVYVSPSNTTLQNTYFTLVYNFLNTVIATAAVSARTLPGNAGGLQALSNILPECPFIATNTVKWATLRKGAPSTQAGAVVAQLGVNAQMLTFFTPVIYTEINNNLYASGGCPSVWDGHNFVEQNFNLYPEGITTVPSGTGGSLGTGTYYYCVTYAYEDQNGQTWESSPSVPFSVVFAAGATNSVQLTIPTLRLTRNNNVQIRVYRTAANGLFMTRITSSSSPFFNNATVDTLTYTDTQSDASIASNGALYTQPLVTTSVQPLQNSPPPACTVQGTFDDRLWVGGLDDPNQLWYTEQQSSGIPMQFSASQYMSVDNIGGAITFFGRMDGNAIVGKHTAILYFNGTGPDATGQNNGYSQLLQVPSGGIGFASQKGAVLTPKGIMFQSNTGGVYLLDRGLNVSYVGAPVEAFTKNGGFVVTSATILPDQWVIFTSAAGTSLVYDYLYDQWSTFTNHAAADSCLYQGDFTFLSPTGTIMQQTPTVFTDNGTPIPISIQTAKIALAQIQGYQRVYEAFILGAYRGQNVTLTLGCAFDYDTQIDAQSIVPVDTMVGLTGAPSSGTFGTEPWYGSPTTLFQWRADILRKCESIQFQITDAQTGTGNEGYALSAITLNVGVKRGGQKVSPTKQFGVA